MYVNIEKFNEEELVKRGVFDWPIWEKEESQFDWHYDEAEECYFLKGKVTVEIPGGKTYDFGKGDFVTFARGLTCVWHIHEAVKKHYNFK